MRIFSFEDAIKGRRAFWLQDTWWRAYRTSHTVPNNDEAYFELECEHLTWNTEVRPKREKFRFSAPCKWRLFSYNGIKGYRPYNGAPMEMLYMILGRKSGGTFFLPNPPPSFMDTDERAALTAAKTLARANHSEEFFVMCAVFRVAVSDVTVERLGLVK